MHLLTSFFLSILLATTMHSMEQPLDLSEIVRTCPNQIVCHLDGKSLTSLASVSHILQETCDAVPAKYLNFFLGHAVLHKNRKLIDRFIEQLDSWMFTPEIDNVVIHQEKNGNDTIGLFKFSFGKGVQDFFQTQAFMRFTQNNKTVRYLFSKKDIYENHKCQIYLNAHECSNAVDIVLKSRLSPKAQEIASNENYFNFIGKSAHGGYIGIHPNGGHVHRYFSISNSSKNMPENLLRQFGFIITFLISAQKNRTKIVYAILNNTKIIDSWSSDILEITLYDLDCNNEITDVVAAVLFERKEKTLNAKK